MGHLARLFVIIVSAFVLGFMTSSIRDNRGRYQISVNSAGSVVHRLDTTTGVVETFWFNSSEGKLVPFQERLHDTGLENMQSERERSKEASDELIKKHGSDSEGNPVSSGITSGINPQK